MKMLACMCLSLSLMGTLYEVIKGGINDEDPALSRVLRATTAVGTAVVTCVATFIGLLALYDWLGLPDPSPSVDPSVWGVPVLLLTLLLSIVPANLAAVIAGEAAALLGKGVVKGCIAMANGVSQCMRLTYAYDNSAAPVEMEKTPLLPETVHITCTTINDEDDNNSKDTKKGWMRIT